MKKTNNSAAANILAILFTIVMFLLVWKVILPGYSTNKANMARLDQEIAQAQAKKASLDQAKLDLGSIDAAYKAITVSVSDEPDEANIIAEMEAIALKNGIQIPSMTLSIVDATAAATPEVGAVVTPGTPVKITLSIPGTFEKLNGFVSALEKSVKFMNIKSMTYSIDDEGVLSLSLEIEAYSRVQPVDPALAS